jgi:hypothetical protein
MKMCVATFGLLGVFVCGQLFDITDEHNSEDYYIQPPNSRPIPEMSATASGVSADILKFLEEVTLTWQ